MSSLFLGMFFSLVFLYFVVAAVLWGLEKEATPCWYCRFIKVLSWPYWMYKELRY